jgi:hypothetical protein
MSEKHYVRPAVRPVDDTALTCKTRRLDISAIEKKELGMHRHGEFYFNHAKWASLTPGQQVWHAVQTNERKVLVKLLEEKADPNHAAGVT